MRSRVEQTRHEREVVDEEAEFVLVLGPTVRAVESEAEEEEYTENSYPP